MFLYPWEGKNYNSGINGEKVFIFGESHYDDDEPLNTAELVADIGISNYTSEVVRSILLNKKYVRFFKRIGCLFNEDWTKIWDYIAFANLIQFILENGEQPNDTQIASIDSYYKYLEMLKPNKVIICSARTWNDWFEWHIEKDEDKLISDVKIGIAHPVKFIYNGGTTLAIGINHPSEWKSEENYVERWKPEIEKFLAYKIDS